MSTVRVTPWSEGHMPKPPADLLAAMRARRPDGELIGIARVLLRSFALAEGWNGLLGRVRTEFNLKLEDRELMMLRVAVLNRAEFEWGVHHPAYLKAGGTEDKCDALREDSLPDGVFNDEERALLTLTDQSTRSVEVDAAVIDELKNVFGETVEAVATVRAHQHAAGAAKKGK
ncbi:carboxymuconolactone decarboxylase family protein [Nocardiopsis dassonvillei]